MVIGLGVVIFLSLPLINFLLRDSTKIGLTNIFLFCKVPIAIVYSIVIIGLISLRKLSLTCMVHQSTLFY